MKPLAFILLAALFQTSEIHAFLNTHGPQQSGAAQHGKATCKVELLTDPEGVDFTSTLREVFRSVRDRWFANMPPDIEKGIQGVNQVEFRILRDGNVPKDSVKIVSRSGKDELDTASLRAIGEAAPFSHLPEKFPQPSIVVRFIFFYNIEQPKI